jgi:MSHA biogenesis protein MshE
MKEQTATKISLIEFLYQTKIISADAVQRIRSSYSDGNSDNALKSEGLSEEKISEAMGRYEEMEYFDLNHLSSDLLTDNLPKDMCQRLKVIIVGHELEGTRVGMVNPLDAEAIEEVNQFIGAYLIPVLISETLFNSVFSIGASQDINYAVLDTISGELMSEIATLESAYEKKDSTSTGEVENVAAVRLVREIFKNAYQHGVSDIHLEEESNQFRLRQRVDGVLSEYQFKDAKMAGYLFRRLRIMANLDITKTLIPQDGRISLMVDGRLISARISLIPTHRGHSIVIRLLGDVESYANLEKVIFDDNLKFTIRHFLSRHAGMMLVTGPTGSGKTTTQYCTLMEINNQKKKIISLEDPVEADLTGICQIQINNELGIKFAEMLSSILRQDPDAIMIGEIRDTETANIAMRAAITGHIVLATLHTSDVMTTINRLMNLEMDGYMVASSLRLILSQRLVRLICLHCKEPYEITKADKDLISKMGLSEEDIKKDALFVGMGCELCNHSGFHGREAIMEYLVCDEHLMDILATGDYVGFKLLAEESLRGNTLFFRAMSLVGQGKISLAEALEFVIE